MKLLALDTSADLCSVALHDGASWHEQSVAAGHTHSQRILPMVNEVLTQAGLTLRELDGLAFGAGPGSFTGLRIACGVEYVGRRKGAVYTSAGVYYPGHVVNAAGLYADRVALMFVKIENQK